MATSYSSTNAGFFNVGPITFLPGYKNDLTPSSVLDQNFPLKDSEHYALSQTTWNPDVSYQITAASWATLPSSVVDVSYISFNSLTDVYFQKHVYLADVSTNGATANMAATCGYVQAIEQKWSQYPAVHVIDCCNQGITDCSFITFMNNCSLTCASGSTVLNTNGSGLAMTATNEFDLTHGTQSQLQFDNTGNIQIYSGYVDATAVWHTNTLPGLTLTSSNILQSNFVFADTSGNFTTAVSANGTVTFTMTKGSFPSVLTLPPISIDPSNQITTPLTFGDPSQSLAAIQAFQFVCASTAYPACALPTTGYVYHALITNSNSGSSPLYITKELGANFLFAQNVVAIPPGKKVMATFTQFPHDTYTYVSVQGMNPP